MMTQGYTALDHSLSLNSQSRVSKKCYPLVWQILLNCGDGDGGGGGGDIGTLRSDLYLLILDCSDTNKVIVHTSEELSNLFIDGCFNEEGCITK